jgi:hypothetical protein
MTLGDFGNLLDALIVGQTCTLPYDVYAVVFPPGEPDQDARTRAFDFARDRGCTIENMVREMQVVFTRQISNPVSRKR